MQKRKAFDQIEESTELYSEWRIAKGYGMTLRIYAQTVSRWERRWNTLASILESYKQVYGSLPPDKRTADWYTRLDK